MATRVQNDRRKVTREDVFLKSRMLSLGVRIDVEKAPPGFQPLISLAEIEEQRRADDRALDLSSTEFATSALKQQEEINFTECFLGNVIVMDGAEIALPIVPEPRSPLTLTLNGYRVAISESGKVLATGTYYSANTGRAWAGRILSNGLPIEEALHGSSPGIVNVLFSLSCYNHNSGQACRYCGLFANKVSEAVNDVPISTLREYARIQAEAVEIMTEYGWRGVIAFGGGVLPPSSRGESLDRLEAVVEPLHDRLAPRVLSELHLVYNHYPPADFADFYRIRKMGIQSTSIDMEVVTPKTFKTICPGKYAYRPLEYWKEVLLEGIHERLSKGVFPVPLQFLPAPGSAMAKAQPQTAEWIADVAEQVAKAYIQSFTKLTGPFGRAVAKSFMRKLAPKALRPLMPQGWDVPHGHAMPMAINCVAIDELVRQVHRIPGGRFVPLPNLGIQPDCEAS